MINIDKSIFILSGFLPMTEQEEELFNFENPTKEITILGRDYIVREIERSSDGTFKVSLIPFVKIKIDYPIKAKTMKTHVGSVREWEGPIENWEAHAHEIKHWCDGCEVEAYQIIRVGWYHEVKPDFSPDVEYCIKQREPKAGEVWILGKNKTPAMKTEIEEEFANLKTFINCDFYGEKVYAAPSVEAYFARKFWNKVHGKEGILTQTMADKAAHKMSNIVEEAAKLDH